MTKKKTLTDQVKEINGFIQRLEHRLYKVEEVTRDSADNKYWRTMHAGIDANGNVFKGKKAKIEHKIFLNGEVVLLNHVALEREIKYLHEKFKDHEITLGDIQHTVIKNDDYAYKNRSILREIIDGRHVDCIEYVGHLLDKHEREYHCEDQAKEDSEKEDKIKNLRKVKSYLYSHTITIIRDNLMDKDILKAFCEVLDFAEELINKEKND